MKDFNYYAPTEVVFGKESEEQVGRKMDIMTATDAEKGVYWDIQHYWHEKYYYDNIDAFLEYQSHMGEHDFDWGFYSDWHKDMYGFRPR